MLNLKEARKKEISDNEKIGKEMINLYNKVNSVVLTDDDYIKIFSNQYGSLIPAHNVYDYGKLIIE